MVPSARASTTGKNPLKSFFTLAIPPLDAVLSEGDAMSALASTGRAAAEALGR
jgi:hypothetical protein